PRLMLTSGGASRIVGNFTALSIDAWFSGALAGDADSLAYDGTKPNQRLPNGALLTPGAPNFKPATSSSSSSSSSSTGGTTTADDEKDGLAEAPSGTTGTTSPS